MPGGQIARYLVDLLPARAAAPPARAPSPMTPLSISSSASPREPLRAGDLLRQMHERVAVRDGITVDEVRARIQAWRRTPSGQAAGRAIRDTWARGRAAERRAAAAACRPLTHSRAPSRPSSARVSTSRTPSSTSDAGSDGPAPADDPPPPSSRPPAVDADAQHLACECAGDSLASPPREECPCDRVALSICVGPCVARIADDSVDRRRRALAARRAPRLRIVARIRARGGAICPFYRPKRNM